MDKNTFLIAKVFSLLLIFISHVPAFAQAAPKKANQRKAPVSSAASESIAAPSPTPTGKKNGRPTSGDGRSEEPLNKRPTNDQSKSPARTFVTTHHYEFSQPNFNVSKVVIKHDDAGKGELSFTKKDYDDFITDPIQLSTATLERINATLTALNFLGSDENYQYEKDFSHLGTITFRLVREGKERSTTFNWTQNKDAKSLMDEYRQISNQFIWMFDIALARENQPLEAPRLMDSLDSMIRRNEISDPKQMAPFLQTLVNDERIPLIARNHAGKLAKKLESGK